MLFSALALLLCQEPSLRWSRDVDEQFWQALHQLEVEERAEDAAATLASLLDEPSVQQFRGQTGYLLAQQYRALRAAGLMEEAEALLPSIRRDVANTDMAQLAESVITLADRSHPNQDGANEELLELLLSAANQDTEYLRSVMSSYGERIVPELLMIFDRPEDYVKANPTRRSSTLIRLWMVACSNDLGGFFDSMASRIRIRSIEYFDTLPIATEITGQIGESQRAFLIRLSEDPRSVVAETGLLGLLGAIPDRRSTDRLIAVINEGSLLSPLVLDQVMSLQREREQVAYHEMIIACLESEDDSIRAAAHSMVRDRRIALGLHHLADVENDRGARHRLLGAVFDNNVEREVEAGLVSLTAFPSRLRDLLGTDVVEVSIALPRVGIPQEDGSFLSWKDWRSAQARSSDSSTRALALAALLRSREYDGVIEILNSDGAPEDFPALVSASNLFDLPVLSDYLLPFLSDGSMAERAWKLLQQGNAISVVLRPKDMEWAFENYGKTLNQEVIGKREDFAGDDDTWLIRYLAIMESSTLPIEFRLSAATGAMRDFKKDPTRCLRIGESILERFPMDRDWDPSSSSSVPFNILTYVANAMIAGDTTGLSSDRWDAYLSGMARYVEASFRGKNADGRSVDAGLPELAANAQKAGLSVTAFLRQAMEYPAWLNRDRQKSSRLLKLAIQEGPEFFEEWVRACVDQKIECRWSDVLGPWSPSLIASPDRLLEIEIGLREGGPEFESSLMYGVRSSLGSNAIEPVVLQFLDPLLPQFMTQPHTASNAIIIAVARGLDSDEFARVSREAWAIPDLGNRDALLNLVGSRYTPELVPLLLDAQVSHSSQLAKIADEALARYARIRDARSGWAAWERQGRDGSPIDALVAKTAVEKSKVVRLAAIQSLGTLEAKEALPFLVELLEDSDQEIVAAVQAALARIHAAAEGSDE